MQSILFVCHGNICRSPMAEFIFKDIVRRKGLEEEYHIESAAVSNEEFGNPVYPSAKSCLARHGVPVEDTKRSRKVTPADYGRFDRIVCMDKRNLRLLSGIIGDDPEGKVCLLMFFTGQVRDVADPWYTGDFEAAYRDILEGCEAMLPKGTL